jgi:hypothetical protein
MSRILRPITLASTMTPGILAFIPTTQAETLPVAGAGEHHDIRRSGSCNIGVGGSGGWGQCIFRSGHQRRSDVLSVSAGGGDPVRVQADATAANG